MFTGINKVSVDMSISSRTLRYWEAAGLFKSIRDVQSGWRMYDEHALQCIRVTDLLRRLDLSIRDIKEVIDNKTIDSLCHVLQKRLSRLEKTHSDLETLKTPKVPRQYFIRLYKSDVRMIIDSELLDEVGFMLYVRCLQAKEECELSKAGKLKCHNCGVIITSPPNGLIVCDCGYSYIFREYMRSFNKNQMPYGAANPFFSSL